MNKVCYTEREIESLISRFEAQQLPKVEWTHEAHLVIAIWYCSKLPLAEALEITRENITRHNESVGTPNTDTEGYHETITCFWLWVASQFLGRSSFSSVEEACNAFIDSSFSKSNYPLNYYSEELLFSTQARFTKVPTDLNPLSRLI